MTTHKEALTLALEALTATMSTHGFKDAIEEVQDKAITAIKEALAQPEHEPYAWEFAGTIFHDRKEVFDWYERGDISDIPPLDLYTTPPHRKPLTDEEIERLRIEQEFDQWAISEGAFKYAARAIEAAHGIKGDA